MIENPGTYAGVKEGSVKSVYNISRHFIFKNTVLARVERLDLKRPVSQISQKYS